MTEELFRQDAYLRQCDATVVAVDGDGVWLDRTVFYPSGVGSPGTPGFCGCLRDGNLKSPIRGRIRPET